MLAAIGTYVLTLDDSIQPGSAAQGGIPAAAAPAVVRRRLPQINPQLNNPRLTSS